MKTNLSKIQLNLLLALDVLLRECHVTRAGEKLFLSQSAMSNLLKQLREVFQDELLVRGAASSMTLTPRAQALKAPVKEALEKAALVFSVPKPFDPAIAKRTFILGMSDYTELVLLPKVVQYITKVAPHIDIVIQHLNFIDDRQTIALENDKLDLAIGICLKMPAAPLLTEELFTDNVVCVGAKNNLLLKKPLTLKQYANAHHLLIVYAEKVEQTYSEQLLLEKGYRRRAVVTVPHTLAALYTLPGTQLVTTVLERVLSCVDIKKLDLSFQCVPFRYPKPAVSQVWHPKNNDDAAHRWLRQTIRKVASI